LLTQAELIVLNKVKVSLEKGEEEQRRLIVSSRKAATVRSGQVDSADVSVAVAEQQRLGASNKARLDAMIADVKGAFDQLHRARDELERTIKRESVSLGLLPESTFTHHPAMLDPARFPIAMTARHYLSDSALLREASAHLLQHCASVASTARHMLDAAIAESKRSARCAEV
jgi:paraquat-inducible protein B